MSTLKSYRNVYEDDPDQLKELVKNGQNERSQKPKFKTSRDSLLKQHARHLRLIGERNVPTRNVILPLPYPPSRAAIHDSHKVHLNSLCIDTRDDYAFLMLRTISAPYIHSATVTIAEDERGDFARLTICNLEDNVFDPILIEGSIVAIKQPCWSKLVGGGYHIRVDHPSDLVILGPFSDIIPSVWRRTDIHTSMKSAKEWKKDGDMMFLNKRFRKALESYDRGLFFLRSNPDTVCEIDLYRKRCGVHIVLLRLDDAANDLSKAVSVHARSTPSLSSSELIYPSTTESWLRNCSTEDPLQISAHIPRALKELAARIKFDIGIYQSKPDYDLPLMSSYVGPLTLHVDAANYISEIEVRETASHGRGLFAKREFKAGELICAEKAFVLPGYLIQDRSSDCLLYSLVDETAAPRPGALLFKELVQKLKWNPTLRKEFFELDDGGYWKKNGWEVQEGEDIPVDVFRVEFIRRYNCFSVPNRSSDLLNQPHNPDQEMRNGFWINGSYVNHSCLPNSVRTFIGDIRLMRATRTIAAGEEITNQYISPDIDIDVRQQNFWTTWGFNCDCALCQLDGDIEQSLRSERLKHFEELKASVMKVGEKGITVNSIKKIARGVRVLEALYSPEEGAEADRYSHLPRLALIHPTLFLTEAWRGTKNVDKTIETAHKLLRNFGLITNTDKGKLEIMNHAGLVNVETVRALKYLSEAYTKKRETKLAKQCIDMARIWYLIITGAEVGIEQFLSQ